MDDSNTIIKRNIGALFIAFYGVAILVVTIFSFMWDNKGAQSIWQKSTNDWLFIAWLAFVTLTVWLSVVMCFFVSYTSKTSLLILSIILIVHVLFIALEASNEALFYLGFPHLLLAIGLYLWWSSINNANKKP